MHHKAKRSNFKNLIWWNKNCSKFWFSRGSKQNQTARIFCNKLSRDHNTSINQRLTGKQQNIALNLIMKLLFHNCWRHAQHMFRSFTLFASSLHVKTRNRFTAVEKKYAISLLGVSLRCSIWIFPISLNHKEFFVVTINISN